MTLPGVGFILATVIALEVGDVQRFPGPEHFAFYAGWSRGSNKAGAKCVTERPGKT